MPESDFKDFPSKNVIKNTTKKQNRVLKDLVGAMKGLKHC